MHPLLLKKHIRSAVGRQHGHFRARPRVSARPRAQRVSSCKTVWLGTKRSAAPLCAVVLFVLFVLVLLFVLALVLNLFPLPAPVGFRRLAHCWKMQGLERGAIQVAHNVFTPSQTVLQELTRRAPAVSRDVLQVLAGKQNGVGPADRHQPVQVATHHMHALRFFFQPDMRVVAHLLYVALHLGGVSCAKLAQIGQQVLCVRKQSGAHAGVKCVK